MKNISLLFLIAILGTGCTNTSQEAKKEPISSVAESSLLRHIVLFKFNETSSPEDITKLENAFAALPSKIKEIKDIEWGLNNSPEGLDKGFTHCFFVSFESEQDRAIYLPHPSHQAFVDMLGPHVADVLVLDYWTK